MIGLSAPGCADRASAAAAGPRASDMEFDALDAPIPPAASLPPVAGEIVVRFRSEDGGTALLAAQSRFQAGIRWLDRNRPGAPVQLQTRRPIQPLWRQLAVVTVHPDRVAETLDFLNRQREVAYAEPNFRLRIAQGASPAAAAPPDDFHFDQQWSLHNTGQTGGTAGADIRILQAWSLSTGSRQVRVAVIDTGLDFYHADLRPNLWVSSDIPGNGVDDDGNGFIDDVHGYDFVSDDSDPLDDNGHGTHVAGIMGAAANNRRGIAGVCPEVTLLAVKAFDETGNSTIDQAVRAIQYAIQNGAHIINASWGLTDKSRALEDAIRAAQAAGILIVAAAGNDNADQLFYPAVYDDVLSVASTDANDLRSRFSNYGPRVDLAAPGELVFSTQPDTRYEFFSGTSMAAPHVSGVAALVLSLHPAFTSLDVANILRNSVDPLTTDRPVGTGRINAAKALAVNSPLPFVRLEVPEAIYGVIDLTGSVRGANLRGYRIEFGAGAAPTTWTVLAAGNQPVEHVPLVAGFDTSSHTDGTYSFRLIAENEAGFSSSSRRTATLGNLRLDSPHPNDILRLGEEVEIRGTVFGPGRTYTLDYGVGRAPTEWRTNGITPFHAGRSNVLDGLLGTWDTTALSPEEFYTLRLTGFENGRRTGEKLSWMIYLEPRLHPGWPQYVPLTPGEHPTNDWRNFTLADLDLDGTQEILLVNPGTDLRPGTLLAYGHDGTLRWSRSLPAGEPYVDVPVVGDLDGDGFPEIAVDVGVPSRIAVFRHDGSPFGSGWPASPGVSGLGKVIADLDGDGRAEIIGCSQVTKTRDQPRELIVFHSRGEVIRRWPLEPCDTRGETARIFPAVADLDGDGLLDIVAQIGCSKIGAFSLTQTNGPLWEAYLDGEWVSSPVIGDLNDDGKPEIVLAVRSIGRSSPAGIYLFDHDGQRRPGWPMLPSESFTTAPVLADLDGDRILEIIALSESGEMLHVLNEQGFALPGWPVGPIKNSTTRASPIIGDINGDSLPDIVLASPGFLAAGFRDGDREQLGGLRAWRFDGRPIPLGAKTPSLPMESSTASWHRSSPAALADVNGDGLLDAVAMSILDRTYAPAGETSIRKNRSSLYVWNLARPHRPEHLPWPMRQVNPQHTGRHVRWRAPNQPPRILDLPHQIAAPGGRFVTLDLPAYVDDPDHPSPAITWTVSTGIRLTATVSPDKQLSIAVSDPAWTGAETFRLTARDPAGAQAETSVTYTIQAGYVPPAANPDSIQIEEDHPAEIHPLANDTDPAGGELRVAGFSRPKSGRVSRGAGDRLIYQPHRDFFGADEFSYTLDNGRGGLAIGTITIEVTPVNDPPHATADFLVVEEDSVGEIDVLKNDFDVDLDPITLLSFTTPTNGVLESLGEGRFRYQPKADFAGRDQFTYDISDPSGARAGGKVVVQIKPINDPPDGDDQHLTLNRNASVNFTFTARDVEGDRLTYTVRKPPEHGELLAYPAVATYTPRKAFVGVDSFSYQANDGQSDSREILVELTILDANNPPKVADQTLVTRFDQPLPITLSAEDFDGDDVRFDLIRPPDHGQISGSGTTYVYHPAPGYLGDDLVRFAARDTGGGETEIQISIRVTNENTPPVAEHFPVQARANTESEFTLRAKDPESNPLTYRIVKPPLYGLLAGEPPLLRYRPQPDFVGSDRFTFTAHDGEFESDPGTVSISVSPFNRLPVTTNQSITILKNTATPIPLDVTDEDGDPLVSPILKGPRHGRVYGLGTLLTYVPRADYTGPDDFTFRVWDEHHYSRVGRVNISVVASFETEPLRFLSVTPESEDRVVLELVTTAGLQYEIFFSTDLVEWKVISRAAASADRLRVIHTDKTGSAARYYRATRLP